MLLYMNGFLSKKKNPYQKQEKKASEEADPDAVVWRVKKIRTTSCRQSIKISKQSNGIGSGHTISQK